MKLQTRFKADLRAGLICTATLLAMVAHAATLGEALDATNLIWTTGGDAPWLAQTGTRHDGRDAVQSGRIGDGQKSWLQTTAGPGVLCFWWKVSSEPRFDYLKFYVNGVLSNRISGHVIWQQQTYALSAATNTLRWEYDKDGSDDEGLDTGLLDQVHFATYTGPPSILCQPARQFVEVGERVVLSVTAAGALPLHHQWRMNGTALADSANAALIFTNVQAAHIGEYDVVIANPVGSVTSRVARLARTVNPLLVGRWAGWADSVAVAGGYAYVGSPGYFDVLDVRDPANPLRVGGCVTDGQTFDIAVAGHYAYLRGYPPSGLHIINVGDPANPVLVSSYATGWANNLAVSGNTAYLVSMSARLDLIDVSNPTNLTRLGSYEAPRSWSVAVVSNYVYLGGSGLTGLQVLDGSNSTNLVPLGSYDAGDGSVDGVVVSGNRAYVIGEDRGFGVIDVSAPATPIWIGGSDAFGYGWHLAVSDNRAYLADDIAGLQIIDVSEPANPVRAGGYSGNGDAWDVAVSGEHLFVAGPEGVAILRMGLPPALGLARGAGPPGIRVAGDVGQQYVLEYASTLSATNTWTALPAFTLTNSPQTVADTTATDAARRFYRARLAP